MFAYSIMVSVLGFNLVTWLCLVSCPDMPISFPFDCRGWDIEFDCISFCSLSFKLYFNLESELSRNLDVYFFPICCRRRDIEFDCISF